MGFGRCLDVISDHGRVFFFMCLPHPMAISGSCQAVAKEKGSVYVYDDPSGCLVAHGMSRATPLHILAPWGGLSGRKLLEKKVDPRGKLT